MTNTPLPFGVLAGTAAYPWPHLSINVATLAALIAACRSAGVGYGLGSKAPTLSAVPGRDFHAIDCSGFVRWSLYQAAGHCTLPDGSVVQHDWIEAHGFKKSDVASAELHDGAVRIAFLSPADGGGIGHVVLIVNGQTVESHGHYGPDRRFWTGDAWQGKCAVYVLAPPLSTIGQ